MMIIACVLILSLIATSVHAETFELGEKEKEMVENNVGYTNSTYMYYDSGAVVTCQWEFKDYIPLILDGNTSTGMNFTNSGYDFIIGITIQWENGIYVDSIKVLNEFQGKRFDYQVGLCLDKIRGFQFILDGDTGGKDKANGREFKVDCLIYGISLNIFANPYGSEDFYFNDLIINYTPAADLDDDDDDDDDDAEDLQSRIDDLEAQNTFLTTEVDNLKTENAKLQEDVNTLKAGDGDEDEDEDDNTMLYVVSILAFCLGFFGTFIGLVAFLKKPRGGGLFEDERVERPRSKK